MRVLVACLAIIAVPLAVLGMQVGHDEIKIPDDPLGGRVLLERKHCLDCHGLVGDETRLAPELGHGHFSGTFLELGASLWNHVPGMRVMIESAGLEWPELSGREATELIAFLYFIDYLGQPGDAAAGLELFHAQGCATCHSVGEEGEGIGPDLGELDRYASALYVAQQLWNHGPAMLETIRRQGMRAPVLRAGDLANLSAYIRQQTSDVPRVRQLLAPGNPNNGGTLFAGKGCSQCHGLDARGGSGGPDLAAMELRQSAESIAVRMWNHALDMRSAMSARGVSWPNFEGSEMADLVAFLYFLSFTDPPGDADRGSVVFQERACSTCHVDRRDDVGAPDLLGTDASESVTGLVAAMWNHAPLMLHAILAESQPWPELTGPDLRDLHAYLHRETSRRP